MKKIIFLLFLFFACNFFAQRTEKLNAKFTIRGSFGIPKTISSKMFRTSFNGVYEGNLSFNLRVAGNFFAGLGYQNTFLQNNKQVFVFYTPPNSKVSITYNTKLMAHGAYLKLGYDKFFSERGYITYALNSGFLYGQYLNVVTDSSAENMPFISKNFAAPYVQPEASVNVVVDKTLSFSFMINYTTAFYKFDPKAPQFAHFEAVKNKSNNYFMSWFSLAVGFNVLIGKSDIGYSAPPPPEE